jgi:hypothetical protein
MNNMELLRKINNTSQLVRHSNRIGSHRNCIRIAKNEGLEHRRAKFIICDELVEHGKDFITESIFEKGGRCDILDLTDGIGIEIISSEKKESINNKKHNYPVPFISISIKTLNDEEIRKLLRKKLGL